MLPASYDKKSDRVALTQKQHDRISSLNPRMKEGNVPKVSTARSGGAKPKLGQHFLTDPMAPGRIADALGDISRSTVFEIGPGRGALTSLLAKRARRLIAIETDRVLAAQLRMNFSLYGNVEIIEGDVLAVDFDSIFGPKPGSTRPGINQQPERVQVVGNLPFFITSDILLRLFAYRRYFESSVLMVQREVADRLAAEPGSSEYGLLSATTQLYTTVEKLFTLPPTAFTPPPKVHSTVVRLTVTPRLESLQVPETAFINFLKLSFGQKRKTLWNNLKAQYETKALRAAMEKAGVKSDARSEALSLEKTAALFRALSNGKTS
jgi:16S rRNA (adenine1518-N6/adenine1519-N6)-dimethyltransferase